MDITNEMYGHYKPKCMVTTNQNVRVLQMKCMVITNGNVWGLQTKCIVTTNPMYLPIILAFYDNVFTNLVGIFFAKWASYTGV